MTAIITILVLMIIFYVVSTNKKTLGQNTLNTNFYNKSKSEKGIQDGLPKFLNKKGRIKMAKINSSSNKDDKSIIDVTHQLYRISSHKNLKVYGIGVPYWADESIDSYHKIEGVSNEKKEFYLLFKKSFLEEKYLDLDGNLNYAFILLFDLCGPEYETHLNLQKLTRQLDELASYFPETKPYVQSVLLKKIEEVGYVAAENKIEEIKTSKPKNNENIFQSNYQNEGFNYNQIYYDSWNLGSKYKKQLNLSDWEVNFLNNVYYPGNNFYNIEYCCTEIVKLYISLISSWKASCIAEGTTIEDYFLDAADVIAKKEFRYRNGSRNYKACIEMTTNLFCVHILKYCENAVRVCYGYKRKINVITGYDNANAITEYQNKILSKVSSLLPVLVSKIAPIDEETDIELYLQNANRWKIKFDELTTNYNQKPEGFVSSIIYLVKLNNNNPSVAKIFFEATKFMANHDKETTLSLYIYYLYYDLQSENFSNKKLPKTVLKNLFTTSEQLHNFEVIVSELLQNKNLNNALNALAKIYEVRRKKIQLDIASIKEVQQQHAGTVELLNEYLKDDLEAENKVIKSQEISKEEIKIEAIQQVEDTGHAAFASNLSFTPIHISTLAFFSKNNYSVPLKKLETFAKSKGVFKNQLIESINEICYELLDDVLIEEEDDCYTINTNYFQIISTK